jgi:hypothetical protein
MALAASVASAVVLPPTTIDGPSTTIIEFGGIAMASDGTGGLVYTKNVEGVPHVFAARYNGNRWSAPFRVDWDQPFDASQPRIAADTGGRLLVVWVTQVATVEGAVRRGLFSASLDKGAASFGPSLLVDPNVGDGTGVDPAVAGVSSGKAIVAYRVVTNTFPSGSPSTATQLRPGDVMADIRVARLNGDRWSRLGAINRNPAASMRPPSPANAPQVGIGAGGNAVVAWQEPDQTGAARIWARRVFGSSLGPPIEASPDTWEGRSVTGDADGFAMAVTAFDQARIVSRIAGEPSGPRLFLGTLEPNYAEFGAKLNGPRLVAGPGSLAGPVGTPAVAASDIGGGEGAMRLAFVTGGEVRRIGVDGHGNLVQLGTLATPAAERGAEAVTAVDAEGGGVTAYEAVDPLGRPAIAVRQEFPSGAVQTGLVLGNVGGPVSELGAGRSEGGDALIGFLQGEPGGFEIVADRVSTPPARFNLRVPSKWVRPRRALVRWQPAPSTGEVSYAVVLNGRVIRRGLGRRRFLPRPALLGSGTSKVRILATDGLGGQFLTRAVKLRVDSEPPTATVRTRGLRAFVRLGDRDSGVRSAACSFGDGSGTVRARSACAHTYGHGGLFTVLVRERDKVGNRIVRHLRVRVR